MSAAEAVLRLEAVTRVHGEGPRAVTALKDVDLVLGPGEFVAVMGPNEEIGRASCRERV